MKRSSIGYCDFSSGDLNVACGCTPASVGCQNCYARAIYDRFGLDFAVTVHYDKLARLAKKRFPQDGNKRGPHTKPLCFMCDTGDLFHEDVPDEFIMEAFRVMRRSDATWLVLTKRARRMREFIIKHLDDPHGEFGRYSTGCHWPFPHVWLGVTAENQAMADERIPLLLETPAAVRWVSVEPMLGPVDLSEWLCPDFAALQSEAEWEPVSPSDPRHNSLSWVVCGAESGANRRPFDPQWALALFQQCKAEGVAFFGKQGSALIPGEPLVVPGYGTLVQEWPI